MRFAISNIAWDREDEPGVAEAMLKAGIRGVELAPTKIWPDPSEIAQRDVVAYRRWWEERGIAVVALQALLYGRPDLRLFADGSARRATLDHLERMMWIGGVLGARALVFGSPKNRRAGHLSSGEAESIAVEFFRAAAEAASGHGTVLCVEANPEEYGCDFVTTTAEAARLVAAVDSPGFGLHLDTGGMVLSGEDVGETVRRHCGGSRHFHASEPFLAPLDGERTPHGEAGRALRRGGYSGWISVEMRTREDVDPAEEIHRIGRFLKAHYEG